MFKKEIEKNYYLHKKYNSKISFVRPKNLQNGFIKVKFFIDALYEFDIMIDILLKNEIPISEILGLRNLSAFIGEVYNRSVKKVARNLIENNPHQDGYPDLLIMDKQGKIEWNRVKNQIYEKEPFTSFATGGIEVKATCGDLRTAKWFRENLIKKPQIGDSRLEWVTGYNWKAHHRETNNLIGIIWDFVENKPKIVSVMYSNSLTEEDWGKTVTPKKGGGRTTSVSIMNAKGIRKMRSGLIAMIKNDTYVEKMLGRLNKY